MKKARHGFTLIEIALFLAVTTALFVGITTATQNSIFQQRFTDSVQNFAEFMRSVYSQVANVQNEKTGRSQQAIYGKVVTFDVDSDGRNQIKSYNLIADVEFHEVIDKIGDENQREKCNRSGSVIAKLACLNANVVSQDSGTGKYHTVGFVTDYTPTWSAGLQTVEGWKEPVRNSAGSVMIDNPGFIPYKGIIVITHSPDSGNIFTYVMQSTDGPQKAQKIDEIIDAIAACENGSTCDNGNPFIYANTGSGADVTRHLFTDSFDGQSAFVTTEVNFCINPYGTERTTLRRNIRIPKGNHTASGVQVVDDSENSCRE